jgi:opacity protein-like surface antigen
MMKRSRSLLAACVLAVATLGPASAADISAPSAPLTLIGDTAGFFGDAFDACNSGNTFADRFTFTVGDVPFNVDAIVASISRSAVTGLDITAFSLYGAANDPLTTGSPLSSGAIDVWQLTGDVLDPGSYYLQVEGTVLSGGTAAYGGAVQLVPVPEPATLGMLASGLGLLGLAMRRRVRHGVQGLDAAGSAVKA